MSNKTKKACHYGGFMKYRFYVSSIISLVVLAMLFIGCSLLLNNLNSMDAALPSLSGKADGTYRGEYSLTPMPVTVVLDVYVQSEQLVKIDIVKHTAPQ
jgi:uncharacterized protein with FMN-binding domain